MHIPDGYLSPSTCATLYVFAGAGWYAALRKTKRVLLTRAVPLISVFAAFSFVLMMFNLPLPGGTTGHAVGVAVAAIVLGPWSAILALSIALTLQALFFGDGGITTLGANCFNMAVVGAFVAYGVYRLIAANAPVTSRRRTWAAAIAGYVSINAAALITAVEFGIQPTLFHDASGTPLYAPYPLHIAIPAMMIGHLTIAGLAEAVITGGLVSYLQRANAGLLQEGAATCSDRTAVSERALAGGLRRLWALVALIMLLTPLGILAAGTAWGEWSAADMQNPQMRSQIASSSRSVAPAADPPQGLQRLSALWTAPFPEYAPAFVKSASFGYLLSAVFGTGVLLGGSMIASALVRRRQVPRT